MEENQCRTCLGEATDTRLTIDRRVHGACIRDMIERLTQIKISNDDLFSKTLCKKCFNGICNGFAFRTKFIDTERTLNGFKKKLISLQHPANVKEERSIIYLPQSSENSKFDDEEYDMIEDVNEEEEIEVPQHYVMEVSEQNHIVAYETEGEVTDGVQYVEYEQVEYLEGDSGHDILDIKTESQSPGPSGYCCIHCELNFKTEYGMRYHLFFYHNKGSNPTICETCNIEYPLRNFDEDEELIYDQIQLHQSFHTENKYHSCTECFIAFKTLKQLETHMQAVHGSPRKNQLQLTSSISHLNENLSNSSSKDNPEKSFKCYICNKVFNMGIAKKKHIKEDHKDKIGQDCPLCLRCKIPSAVAFENHYKTHFVEPRFNCNFCNQFFYESDRLQMHIRRFHDRTRYYCFFCSKDFRDKSGIARHILGVHFNARNFKCSICLKKFTASYNLKEHMFAVHKQASTIYTCALCSQDYLYRKQFERHREKCQGVPDKRRR